MRLLAPLALLLAPLAAMAQVPWADVTLEAALARAKKEKRWALVDVGASWCTACREMDERVYSRPDVARGLAPYVALRVDGEEGEGASIAKRYHVVGFPTLLVLTPDGREVDRLMGTVEPADLLATLEAFRAGRDTLAALERRAATSKNPTLLAEVARRHALRGDPRAPVEIEAVVAADPENRGGRAAAALLVLGKYYHLRGRKDHDGARRALERLVAGYPNAREAAEAPYHLAIARHGLGDDATALATLEGWLAASRDADRYNGYAWCCYQNGFGRARAIAVAREGLAAFPRADELWDTLARLLAQDGARAEAEKAAAAALALQPGNPYYSAHLAKLRQTR